MVEMTPDSILGLGRGFMESRILLSAVELGVFDLLADAPRTAPETATAIDGDLRGTTVLLDALVGMGLLDKSDGSYACPESVASLLARRAPGSVVPMLQHSIGLWRRWSELTDVVRRGAPAHAAGPQRTEADREAFIGAMHTVGSRMAQQVVAAIDPGGAQRLLDIGGASGTYTQAFLEASPQLRATLFDLPPVIEIARRRLGPTGLLDRISLVAGDFYANPLPQGHDLALLSAIIHQNSAEQNTDLYRKVCQALEPGGRLVIRDHVMSPDHTRPARGTIFAVNMLVGTEGGGTYTFDEIRAGLEAAGFTTVRQIQADEQMSGLVEAFTPA